MKLNYWITALGIAVAAFALPASAQIARPALSSAYIGGTIGQSEVDVDCEGASCDTEDTSWRVFGGYQFNRHFAVEIGYADLGEASIDFGPGDRVEVGATAWDVSLVGSVPVGPVSFFGRLGLYRAETKLRDTLSANLDDSGTGLTYGVGAQYDFTRNVGLRVEWQRYSDVEVQGDKFDVDVLNLGVIWRFQ